MKGDREARGILIRDSNKVVCSAVVKNPRITEREIENIAAMRTVAGEVLRIISMNRAWVRSYIIIHNLAKNPRTPIPTAINILPRIRTKTYRASSRIEMSPKRAAPGLPAVANARWRIVPATLSR